MVDEGDVEVDASAPVNGEGVGFEDAESFRTVWSKSLMKGHEACLVGLAELR